MPAGYLKWASRAVPRAAPQQAGEGGSTAMRCDFRSHAECSCGPAGCRASQPLPEIESRVAAYLARNARLRLAAQAVILLSVFAAAGLAWNAAERRVATVNQEEAAWRK